jgi:hypothetical protein
LHSSDPRAVPEPLRQLDHGAHPLPVISEAVVDATRAPAALDQSLGFLRLETVGDLAVLINACAPVAAALAESLLVPPLGLFDVLVAASVAGCLAVADAIDQLVEYSASGLPPPWPLRSFLSRP